MTYSSALYSGLNKNKFSLSLESILDKIFLNFYVVTLFHYIHVQ